MDVDLKSNNYSTLPHVMVVDDDARIRELVARYLNEHGFLVLEAEDAARARALLELFEVDAAIVDVMMPNETGLEFTASLRAGGGVHAKLPVILLTALGEVEDRISGLESGADDYLPKPFDPRELVLRLNALLRRTKPTVKDDVSVCLGRWAFNSAHGELVDAEGEEVMRLTEGEAQLLKVLAVRAGEVLSRDELAALCDVDGGGRTIDVQVTRLRRKIEEDTRAPRYLQTVRGKGYVLRVSN